MGQFVLHRYHQRMLNLLFDPELLIQSGRREHHQSVGVAVFNAACVRLYGPYMESIPFHIKIYNFLEP